MSFSGVVSVLAVGHGSTESRESITAEKASSFCSNKDASRGSNFVDEE